MYEISDFLIFVLVSKFFKFIQVKRIKDKIKSRGFSDTFTFKE